MQTQKIILVIVAALVIVGLAMFAGQSFRSYWLAAPTPASEQQSPSSQSPSLGPANLRASGGLNFALRANPFTRPWIASL